ncbi:MAG: CDP-glycerol glycerophosphotransferase family protein [Bacteroidaceae bacterium]|nr:CDP-glycerol glycerophosphotransferase family protein [Bacteroidaceae bacterium]
MINKLRYLVIVVYNKIILTKGYSWIRNTLLRNHYDWLIYNYEHVLCEKRKKIKEKKRINVAFYIWEISKWKYESLYRLLEKDSHFQPYIVVVPFESGAVVGQDYIRTMLEVYSYFSSKGYSVFLPLSEDRKRVLSRSEALQLNPDIIFYMNCWHEYGRYTQFGYRENTNALQAYVPYAWMISNRYIEHFNRDFHNYMWKIFYETPIHVEMAQKHAINKGINAVASGYPLLDSFFATDYIPKDVWKTQECPKKRIIWAPHHHMLEKNRCSNFLGICDKMLEIARKYQDKVQFVFKPHPELAKKLDRSIPGWNKEKREQYYRLWETMSNTQIINDEYIDLFLTSDAIIHDCGSFTAEYLCTYKPMLFLEANSNVIKSWNECGKEIAKNIYLSNKGEQIEWFIQSVVLDGKDYMKEQRTKFVNDYLKPRNKEGASAFIYNYIKKELGMS